MDFEGVKAKRWKILGGHGKFDQKSREVNFKKIDILDRGGGVHFFSGKAHFYYFDRESMF